MTFNATEDNLLAFNNVNLNVKSISVDGVNVKFDKFVSNETVIYLDNDDFNIITSEEFPESAHCSSYIDYWNVEIIDDSVFSLTDTYVVFFMDGKSSNGMTIQECVVNELLTLTSEKELAFNADTINTMFGIQPNTKIGFAFVNMSTLETIPVKQTWGTLSGGLLEPLMFSGAGKHTVILELFDGNLTNLPGRSNTIVEANLVDITSLDNLFFDSCNSLTAVTLPSTLREIKQGCFENCVSLTNIVIPNNVKLIDNYAFEGCTNLSSISIGSGIEKFGQNVFDGCSGLPITDGIRYADCYLVEVIDDTISGLNFKKGTKWIGDYAFRSCSNLIGDLVIPEGIIGLGSLAFDSCLYITSVKLPNSMRYLHEQAFGHCRQLKSIDLGEGLLEIGADAFIYCSGIAEGVIIPDSVTKIGMSAFLDCTGIPSITIGSGLTSIAWKAFDGCTNLTGNLYVPESLTVIDNEAFNDVSFASIVVSPLNPVYDSREDCNCIIQTKTNTVMKGCMGSTIPNSVNSIGEYAFYGCTGLTTIVVPDSVNSIDSYAFNYCSDLSSITFGSGITNNGLNQGAFGNCSNLTNITFLSSVTRIESSVFNNCSNLKGYLIIPDSVTYIGYNAFNGCNGLSSTYIGSGVSQIESFAFGDCFGLNSIVVSSDNTVYDSRENCNCIIKTANNNLLYGCNNSFIPNSVTVIGNSAFSGYKGMSGITIPNSVTRIIDYAFMYCSGLRGELVLPDSVTNIGYHAFAGCSGLTSVVLGAGITKIDSVAFGHCSGLTNITCYAMTAPSISSNSFLSVANGGVLYTPQGATGYDSWMSTGDFYLGKYNWTQQTIS